MQSPKILLLESGSSRIVRDISPRNAARMIARGQAERDREGDLRVKPPEQRHEHPCRTRISSGGPLAAMGMSQIYTRDDRRGNVDDFKRIYPEDRECFHLATIEATRESAKPARPKPKPAKVDGRFGGWWIESKGLVTFIESKTAAIAELLLVVREALEAMQPGGS